MESNGCRDGAGLIFEDPHATMVWCPCLGHCRVLFERITIDENYCNQSLAG